MSDIISTDLIVAVAAISNAVFAFFLVWYMRKQKRIMEDHTEIMSGQKTISKAQTNIMNAQKDHSATLLVLTELSNLQKLATETIKVQLPATQEIIILERELINLQPLEKREGLLKKRIKALQQMVISADEKENPIMEYIAELEARLRIMSSK